MIQKINNVIARLTRTSGQTALILILLAAATLIFLAITLNWGRVAQVKTLLTISADESGSALASDAASYGEMQKQTYLNDTNFKSSLTGVLLSVIILIIAIILSCIPATAPAGGWMLGLAIAGMVMTFVTIVLELVWINPMISALWNNLQKNQPIQQQFYEEGGISTALQGAVTDQVNITDYFDWNANGSFGNNVSGLPKDIVGRFAIFYTDRLKMLNQPLIPQVVFFYNQLGELMNGETCAQNAIDNCLNSSIPINSLCPRDCAVNNPFAVSNPFTTTPSCTETSSDPVCQLKIPNGFQLNDACADSNPGSATYNPYCDPCCQLASVSNPLYCPPCSAQSSTCNCTTSGSTTTCTSTNSNGTCTYNPLLSQYVSLRPSNCDPSKYDSNGKPQCQINNPYNTQPGSNDSIYTLLYDPTYQEYANGLSFLDQFGRDQQAPLPQPPGSPPQPPQQLQEPPFTPLTLQGNFPSGIYPFFWLMKDYSPEVDNINPTITPVTSSEYHWCTSAVSAPSGYIPLTPATLAEFPDLDQLTLAYACSGKDCCVDGLANSVTNGVPIITTVSTPGAPSWLIDVVGSPSPAPNPVLDPSFGEGGSGAWLEGDNQMCSAVWPYNGSTSSIPDGTCEWNNTAATPVNMPPPNPNVSTVDSLDDTMHTLSDFVNFANSFLGQNVGTLSASFATWYPQAAVWISPVCDDGSTCSAASQCGDGTMCGRLLPLAPNLNAWNTMITTWLNNNYMSTSAWCVPSEQTLLNGNSSTIEDAYINSNDNGAAWGTLPSVTACLNYNASPTPANLYQACLTALENQIASACSFPPSCSSLILGRSLAGQAPSFTPGSVTNATVDTCGTGRGCSAASSVATTPDPDPGLGSTTTTTTTETCCSGYETTPCNTCIVHGVTVTSCPSCGGGTTYCAANCAVSTPTTITHNSADCNPNIVGSYANWVQNSLILAKDEAPKFILRSSFLADIQTRAKTMQNIFKQGGQELQSFLSGPAAQLISANQTQPIATLPNSVIYGWIDKKLPNGQTGYAHIVKVTAYAAGRNGSGSAANSIAQALLPWIKTTVHLFTRDFELRSRDGYVYVSVKRWDEDHSNSLLFPNGRPLWQFMFHNPTANPSSAQAQIGGGSIGPCAGLNSGIGFGLEPQTVAGLQSAGILPIDQTSLSQAFMLNDEGTGSTEGQVDPSAKTDNGNYLACLKQANALLANAPESHACVEYVASSPSSDANSVTSGVSQHGDADYALKFVDCNSVPGYSGESALEDLKGSN